jgi:monofunctional biosynthetic peptidoglycan transglycosylase
VNDENPDKWVKFLKGFVSTGFLVLKTTWLTLWTVYQIALGAALVMLVVVVVKTGDYFKVWDIRQLRKENPSSTAFIDAERARLTDSLRLAGVWPPPDTLIQWSWISLDSLPKQIQEVLLVAEDAKFFEHQGFDLEEIEYAMVSNHQAGKKFRGASTLTQQVAKNLFLSKDKEMSRKMREAAMTLLLEQYLSKERILEIYLNVAQFDARVFGIRSASEHYYKKPPTQLTQDEIINLICLLPSPSKWSFRKPTSAFLQHKRLVMRNYAMLKGVKLDADSVAANPQGAFATLAEELSEEKWKTLRTRQVTDNGDSGEDSARHEGDSTKLGETLKRLRTF